MRTTEALTQLQALDRPVIETGEAVSRLGISSAHAGWLLRELEQTGQVHRLGRGRWMLEQVDPFVALPYLTRPYPAYVSLWSALYSHGMIEQIPKQVFAVSLDRPRTIHTSIADYKIHRISADVFGGYEGDDTTGFLATPEKALFDTVYLASAQRRRSYTPEIELPGNFDARVLDEWTGRIQAGWLRTKVSRALAGALDAAEHSVDR
jgi:predicted transcriptional regulator of viral defense system